MCTQLLSPLSHSGVSAMLRTSLLLVLTCWLHTPSARLSLLSFASALDWSNLCKLEVLAHRPARPCRIQVEIGGLAAALLGRHTAEAWALRTLGILPELLAHVDAMTLIFRLQCSCR